MNSFQTLEPQSKHLHLAASERAAVTGTKHRVKVFGVGLLSSQCLLWPAGTPAQQWHCKANKQCSSFISLNSFYLKLHSRGLQIGSAECHCSPQQFLQVVLIFFLTVLLWFWVEKDVFSLLDYHVWLGAVMLLLHLTCLGQQWRQKTLVLLALDVGISQASYQALQSHWLGLTNIFSWSE